MPKRICTACNLEFPAILEYFYADKTVKKDGLSSKCKSCRKSQMDKYRETNKDIINEKARKSYVINAESVCQKTNAYKAKNKSKISEANKTYYQNNKIKYRDYGKEYRNINKEKVIERHKKYYSENWHKQKEYQRKRYKIEECRLMKQANCQKRRNKINNLVNDFSLEEWEFCVLSFNNQCAYCGIEKKLTFEHFIPITKDGGFTKKNIIPACDSCNKSKNNRDFLEWYTKQKFYSEERKQKILTYLASVK